MEHSHFFCIQTILDRYPTRSVLGSIPEQ